MTTNEQIAVTQKRLAVLRKKAQKEERERRERIGKMVIDIFPELPESLPEVQIFIEQLAIAARCENPQDENEADQCNENM